MFIYLSGVNPYLEYNISPNHLHVSECLLFNFKNHFKVSKSCFYHSRILLACRIWRNQMNINKIHRLLGLKAGSVPVITAPARWKLNCHEMNLPLYPVKSLTQSISIITVTPVNRNVTRPSWRDCVVYRGYLQKTVQHISVLGCCPATSLLARNPAVNSATDKISYFGIELGLFRLSSPSFQQNDEVPTNFTYYCWLCYWLPAKD